MPVRATSTYYYFDYCYNSRTASFLSTAFFIAKILFVVPFSILAFYAGHQRRQQRRSSATSHSDIFIYHVSALDIIFVFAATLYLCGRYYGITEIMLVGLSVANFSFPGQFLFHSLTCVERYLAVVHPITYLGLRQSGAVKIQNISTVCVWLLSFGWYALTHLGQDILIFILSLLAFCLVIVSYCSLRVVYVLIHPGPGEVGGGRKQIDKSKQRAFHTILVITGVLWLCFLGILISVALYRSRLLSNNDGCVALVIGYWFSLPSNLVLPLLFLQRSGKPVCSH